MAKRIPDAHREAITTAFNRLLNQAGMRVDATGIFDALNAAPFTFNVMDYGAVGDGVTNDHPAFQRAVHAAEKVGSGTVFVPHGQFLCDGLLRISARDVNLMGEGRWTSRINFANNTRSMLLVAPRKGAYGYATSIPHVADNSPGADPAKKALDSSTEKLSVLLTPTLGRKQMNGWGAFSFRCWYQPNNITSQACLFASVGSQYNDTSVLSRAGAVLVKHNNGRIEFTLKTTSGAAKIAATSFSSMAAGVNKHIECDYDGANMRIFVNGVIAATVAQTGTIEQGHWENVTVGGDFTLRYHMQKRFDGILGILNQPQISNVSRHTANFTVPNAHLLDGSTKFLYDGSYSDPSADDLFIMSNGQQLYRVIRDGGDPQGFGARNRITNLSFHGGLYGIYTFHNVDNWIDHVEVQSPAISCIAMHGDSYSSHLTNIRTLNGTSAGIEIVGPSGTTSLNKIKISGADVGVVISHGACIRDYFYDAGSTTWSGLYATGQGGSWYGLDAIGMHIGDEGGVFQSAAMELEDLRFANVISSSIQNTHGPTGEVAIAAAGDRTGGFPMMFDGGDWANLNQAGAVKPIRVMPGQSGNNWQRGRIIVRNQNFYGTFNESQLGSIAGIVTQQRDGAYSNLVGLSSSDTPSKNFAGTTAVGSAATQVTVTFTQPEPNTSYTILLTPQAGAGVAAGALTGWYVDQDSKTVNGFTIKGTTAPGNSGLSIGWLLFR